MKEQDKVVVTDGSILTLEQEAELVNKKLQEAEEQNKVDCTKEINDVLNKRNLTLIPVMLFEGNSLIPDIKVVTRKK